MIVFRRAARARSRSTATVAASSAATTAIRVICQPGMPTATTATLTGDVNLTTGVLGRGTCEPPWSVATWLYGAIRTTWRPCGGHQETMWRPCGDFMEVFACPGSPGARSRTRALRTPGNPLFMDFYPTCAMPGPQMVTDSVAAFNQTWIRTYDDHARLNDLQLCLIADRAAGKCGNRPARHRPNMTDTSL